MTVSNSQVRVFNLFSFIAIIIGIVSLCVSGLAFASMSGAPRFDQLQGVGYVSVPADGQVLTYDASLGVWTNRGVPAPQSWVYNFGNLTDSAIDSPVDGQVLTYDAASGKWVNTSPKTVPLVQGGFSSQAFSLNHSGLVVENFTFAEPFVDVPAVVVGLTQIMGSNGTVVNVEAFNISIYGFNAICNVTGVDVNGYAKFSYVATG